MEVDDVNIESYASAGDVKIPLLKGDKGDKGDAGAQGVQGYSISRIERTSGTGEPGTVDTYTIYINTNPETAIGTFTVQNGTENFGDMTKEIYDTNNNGVVDNAEKVNGYTVEKAVPSNAVFTDTVYDDTELSGRVTALENAGFITKTVSDLVNYYTKTDTYTKAEVNALIDLIPKFDIEVVETLPTTDISPTTIYLVPDSSTTGNLYTEYIYVNNTWEILGSEQVDLSNYYTKSETYNKQEVDRAIASIDLSSYYTKTETDTALSGKVDKVTGKGLSTEDYTTAEQTKLAGIEAEANKTVVDSALSSTSTNPVQNKVIKSHFDYVQYTTHKAQQIVDDEYKATKYPSVKAILDYSEALTNKVTSMSSSSTDTQYPSAKATYDTIKDVDDKIGTLSSLDTVNKTDLVTAINEVLGNQPEIYSKTNEKIVGVWHDGRPIYRIVKEGTSNTVVNQDKDIIVMDSDCDEIVDVRGYLIESDTSKLPINVWGSNTVWIRTKQTKANGVWKIQQKIGNASSFFGKPVICYIDYVKVNDTPYNYGSLNGNGVSY